jgi:RNA polymerase sigma-70 factor (ECF subfamily)
MEPLAVESAQLSASPSAPKAMLSPPAANATGRLGLSELFVAEESGLLRFALSLVGRRAVAEELVQEAFLRLHPVYHEVENPRAWLFRSLRNLALNHLRDRKPESELHEETAPPHADALPAEQLVRDEAIGTVRLLLAELPPEDRELVRLKYLDNLKYQEISRRTGLSVGNVGYRLHHLLKGLADSLRRAGIDGSAR